jgi:hypothetical protein
MAEQFAVAPLGLRGVPGDLGEVSSPMTAVPVLKARTAGR